MILISGCSRSGTSLMMNILRKSLGENRVIGQEFPFKERVQPLNEVQKYISSKIIDPGQKSKEDIEDSIDMNPDGFWEMEWAVKGIAYSSRRRKELKNAKRKPLKAVKVISPGLAVTDPRYVSKVIYMLRHPRNVAKSQERLKNQFGDLPNPTINGEKVGRHSTDMFINVSLMAAQWFIDNPNVKFKIVLFHELQENPEKVLSELSDFLEEDMSSGVSCVNPKLNRSKPKDVYLPEWELAEAIYDRIENEDWEGVLECARTIIVKREVPCFCTRLNRQTSHKECEMCRSDENTENYFLKNSIEYSKMRNIDWENEPCIRDCIEGKTIQESIDTNHWRHVT